ncbi:precorrin-2 C(20)-methyltransferase [uncultured Clostridium sp.]|uniref:precorrin-2 C(20)-methyltransferase n=1 Tax=uncultured Clostridium sp. TaxID=59620 RepID=UPI0025F3FED5|nr:precorrin-2 C(20)-methyltransferase [uncultured Clostridium sp.]
MKMGKLYGVGVGPGDPELLTLKAVRIIEESEVIAIPNKSIEKCVAYKIAEGAVPSIKDKEIMTIEMPMTKDKDILENSYKIATEKIISKLKEGKNIAFLTLGDPTVYSTYIYVHKRILNLGFETEIISGITSFCAAAAKINEGLVERAEELHVIPASYQVEESLKFPGTKVLMKSGKNMRKVKELLANKNLKVTMVENCGMENEKVYKKVEEINDESSYYSLIIVKENTKND